RRWPTVRGEPAHWSSRSSADPPPGASAPLAPPSTTRAVCQPICWRRPVRLLFGPLRGASALAGDLDGHEFEAPFPIETEPHALGLIIVQQLAILFDRTDEVVTELRHDRLARRPEAEAALHLVGV